MRPPGGRRDCPPSDSSSYRRHVLSAIGLALDLVGAVALTLGLYRHSRYATVGLRRGPEDVAQDAGFGTVGASFLALGFVLQGLQYVGVTVEATSAQTAIAAVMTLLLAVLISYVVYGETWLAVHRRELDWVAKNLPEVNLVPRRHAPSGRFGWRFWDQEFVT
jgi:hypothetical protein